MSYTRCHLATVPSAIRLKERIRHLIPVKECSQGKNMPLITAGLLVSSD
jgi:hypothetical protein